MALQLEVSINGRPLHMIGAFTELPDARIAAAPKELTELGIKVPPALAGRALVVLTDIPGATFTYKTQTQSIDIHVEPASMVPKVLDAQADRAKKLEVQTTPGIVLNYGLLASAANHAEGLDVALHGLSAMLEGRVFNSFGTLSMSGVARGFDGLGEPLLLLDTTWSQTNHDSLVTWRVGDFISGGLPWMRSIRAGGVQAQRNFSLRPDLVTMPLPTFSGSAAVPSTVDVYINNTRAYSGEVPAGPFQINNIPMVNGAGTARIVVRDASGRESVTTAPFYASTSLLRPGALDFSAEAGFARHNYGILSSDYSEDPVVSLSARYGLAHNLTLEGHMEGAPTLINAGFGASTSVGAWGRLSGAISLSAGDDGAGGQAYAALEFQARGVDGRISSQRTLADYADLASVVASDARLAWAPVVSRANLAAPPRAIDQLSLGLPLPFDDTRLALNLIHLEQQGGADHTIVSASYSRSLAQNVTLLATAFHDLSAHGGTGCYFGVIVPLGSNGTATTTLTRDNSGVGYGVEASKPLRPETGSIGWQARVTGGEFRNEMAAVAYRGEAATVQGRVMQSHNSFTGTAEVSGSIVAAAGGVFLSNRVDDAFAIVDVGAADVDVMHENRRVAKTDQNGRALIPNLRSHQRSKIAIDPTNLPVDAEIPMTELEVTPSDRAGVAASFGVRRETSSALVVFRTPDGAVVPVGTRGRIVGQQTEFVIGYDGQAFLKNLASTNTATIDGPGGGSCRATFAYVKGSSQAITDPVICK